VLESEKELRKGSSPVVKWIILGLVLVGAGFFAFLSVQEPEPEQEPVLTEEARAYLANLDLQDVEMTAKDDALGQTLLEITGTVVNTGDRPVSLVEVNCVFRDYNGIEIHRQRAAVVRARDEPLAPGESRGFRLPFDSVPDKWNQTLPSLFVAQVQFAEPE